MRPFLRQLKQALYLLIMTKEEFETKVRSLIGERISKVRYFEIDYEGGQEYWNSNSSFDSLDYGLDLEMESGTIKGIIWGSEFYQYGISLISASLDTELKSSRKIAVSEKSRWHELIGSEIKNVKVIWSWVKEVGLFKKKIYYPQDLVLTLSENKVVYISALEIREDTHFGMADNITIFFDTVTACKYTNAKV